MNWKTPLVAGLLAVWVSPTEAQQVVPEIGKVREVPSNQTGPRLSEGPYHALRARYDAAGSAATIEDLLPEGGVQPNCALASEDGNVSDWPIAAVPYPAYFGPVLSDPPRYKVLPLWSYADYSSDDRRAYVRGQVLAGIQMEASPSALVAHFGTSGYRQSPWSLMLRREDAHVVFQFTSREGSGAQATAYGYCWDVRSRTRPTVRRYPTPPL